MSNTTRKGLFIVLEYPLDFRLIVEAHHEVGHQLEQVLPHAQEEVQVEVADVHLAVYPGVIHVTHTLKTVHVVDTEASVHARVRGTFIYILLTPGRTDERRQIMQAVAYDTKKHYFI